MKSAISRNVLLPFSSFCILFFISFHADNPTTFRHFEQKARDYILSEIERKHIFFCLAVIQTCVTPLFSVSHPNALITILDSGYFIYALVKLSWLMIMKIQEWSESCGQVSARIVTPVKCMLSYFSKNNCFKSIHPLKRFILVIS